MIGGGEAAVCNPEISGIRVGFHKLNYMQILELNIHTVRKLGGSRSLQRLEQFRRMSPCRDPVLPRQIAMQVCPGPTEEIETVDEVIEALWERTASEVSQASHRLMGWKCARDDEEIPYHAIFLVDMPLTDDDRQWAREIAEQYGLARTAEDGS